MGVGSTGVACRNTNIHFIGIEINKAYFDKAKELIFKENYKNPVIAYN